MASAAPSDMEKLVNKFKNVNKIGNKFSKLRKKVPKAPKVLKDVQPDIKETLKTLDSCSDFTCKEAADALEYLSHLSEVEDKTLRKNIATYLLEQNYCPLFIRIATNLQKSRQDGESAADQQWFYNLMVLESAYANFAYECPGLGHEFGLQNGPDVLFKDLKEIKQTLANPAVDWACDIATASLGVLHSCFYANVENREIYKQANAAEILMGYCETNNMAAKATSILLLLYITGDLSSDFLDGNVDCVGHMTELLKQAVQNKDHTVAAGNSRLSARELLNCLNLMAVNDANREEIEKRGGVVSMNRMLQPDFSEEEQRISAVGLWNLATESVRRKASSATVADITKSLKSLKKSANKALREASTFALWEIDDRLKQKPGHRTRETGTEPEPSICRSNKPKVPHVMLSYQWSSQKRVLEIRDALVKAGYKVWMDVDKMKGNILTAMADAVEKAAVVVVCMTMKYKDSLNCRSEASYAYKHSKPIVPVILEEGYKPDGWLGLFVGMQLYYELHSNELMEQNLPALIRDIGRRGAATKLADTCMPEFEQSEEGDFNKDEVPPTMRKMSTVSTSSVSEIQDWTTQRVQQWFKENGLQELCSPLDFCDGQHLQDMYIRYKQAPDTFRNDLKSDLKLSFTASVKFTTALEKLPKDLQQ
ncbi:uncharacterized protein [Amphiura filiformis]|uniref:uncharacterized protein isoform X2 n=1 Tax=Amphiura filiformis TaxID=82378 RepID=UPI003B214B81